MIINPCGGGYEYFFAAFRDTRSIARAYSPTHLHPPEGRMTRYSLLIPAMIFAVSLGAPHTSSAQTFKVEKFSIGGDGGTDYLTAEPGTGRVFVSRGTHVMVIDGPTGKVLGDIPDTPRTHGIALAPKSNHGFTTNGGDSTVTMFDLQTPPAIMKHTVPSVGL